VRHGSSDDLKSAVVLGPFDIINQRARADLQNEGTNIYFPPPPSTRQVQCKFLVMAKIKKERLENIKKESVYNVLRVC